MLYSTLLVSPVLDVANFKIVLKSELGVLNCSYITIVIGTRKTNNVHKR